MKRILAWSTFLLLAGARAGHAAYAGADPLNFLFLDADARSVAMGGAYTALANDSNALLYNPAGLAGLQSHEATFMHNQYFQGINQEYLAYASPQGFGGAVNYVNIGNVQRTTISNPDGTGLGTTGLSDVALSAGYGRSIGWDASLGAGLKYIRETIAGVNGQAFALDLGAMAKAPFLEGLRFGAALQNFGPAIKHQTRENLPLNARLGAAYSVDALGQRTTFALDISKENSESAILGAGAETVIAHTLPLRFGYSTRNNAGPGISFGTGWIAKSLSINYAFQPFGDLGSAHRISATVRWGGEPSAGSSRAGADADTPEARFAKADRSINAGRYDDAKRELEEAVSGLDDKDQRRVRYYERLGTISLLRNDCSGAKRLFVEGLKLAQTLQLRQESVADIYLGSGLCMERENEIARAILVFEKGLEQGPSERTRQKMQDELARLRGLKKVSLQ